MGVLKENTASSVTHLQDNTSLALSNGATVAAATNIFDNSSNLGFTASFQLTTNGFGSTSGIASQPVDLYLVPALDGTNYAEVDTSTPNMPVGCYVGSFECIDTNSTQRLTIQGVQLGPYKYKAYPLNRLGQQMSAGWLLDGWYEQEQY